HTDIQGRTGLVRPINGTDTIDSDHALGAVFGVLLKPEKKWSIGFVYNTGFKFELTTRVFGKFGTGQNVVDLSGDYPLDYVIPDRFSGGTSYRFNDRFTAAFDVSRIRYSKQITDNFLILDFRNLTTRENYFIDDVFEFHAGAEYRLYHRSNTIAFRAGLFT